MFIVSSYSLAILLCVITMICWGSWANTQKLAAKSWRYELFYWDYVIGMVAFAALMGFTLGSIGDEGRSFTTDLAQITGAGILSAFIGGVIFNASNILLSASISIAGLAVAFPVGVGLALVLGVFINYFGSPKGDAMLLFTGVAMITVALILNGLASAKKAQKGESEKSNMKGIMLAVVAGVLMSLFYRFVAASMDLDNFVNPAVGKATPYSAFFIFSIGVLVSNFVFNTLLMRHPVEGEPVKYRQFFSGSWRSHSVGVLGGVIWSAGTLFSYIAAGKAGAAISYALGQGAPMIAALWGVFIWKEFKGCNRTVTTLLSMMFLLFLTGLAFIVMAGGN